MKVMSEDLFFNGFKTGSSSKGAWNLLLVEDDKGKHFSFFVKDSKPYEKLNIGDPICLEFYINKNKDNNGNYSYVIRVA